MTQNIPVYALVNAISYEDGEDGREYKEESAGEVEVEEGDGTEGTEGRGLEEEEGKEREEVNQAAGKGRKLDLGSGWVFKVKDQGG